MKADERGQRRRRGGARARRKPREVAPTARAEPSQPPPAEPLVEAVEPRGETGEAVATLVEPTTETAGAPIELPAPPETAFAARVPPPPPPRPLPATRRAIFFDVENTSRPEHIARVIEHLRVDRLGRQTDVIAVGNWRVASPDSARLLARNGAQLVHSAPSTGVRDWSDLRIAVGAGVWLAAARPGDVIEIISDDRAFDAVGDVAAALGVGYRRLSFRSLAGLPAAPGMALPAAAEAESRGRRRRRGRGRHPRDGRPAAPPPHARAHPAPVPQLAPRAHHAAAEAHTAPHDEIVGVARDLIEASDRGSVTIDALANALKARGFRRTPGSPRLITRLRRIKELEISRNGLIALAAGVSHGAHPMEPEPRPETPVEKAAEVEGAAEPEAASAEVETSATLAEGEATPAHRSRRRGRRGGRRHRRRTPEGAAAE